MEFIKGGVVAPKGFLASGMHVGVKTRKMDKKDLALIYSVKPAVAAAVFTRNVVKASPVLLSMENIGSGTAQAIIANSGNANACAPMGKENALRMCTLAAKELGIGASEVLVASTGVIGQTLKISVIEEGIPELVGKLSSDESASDDAAKAIMTTDTVKKELALKTVIGGKEVRLGGISKGSGMIHPNMGTMLCFITTDCAITSEMLDLALKEVTRTTFNRISVDGDTSTNDSCFILANGEAGNEEISSPGEAYEIFRIALETLCREIARKMAKDGEGAKHLITCTVSGAEDEESAEKLSKSIISSTLTKAAIFGSDANWGRVLCAMGYSGVSFDPGNVSVSFKSSFGTVEVCKDGKGLDFDEDLAKKILSEDEVEILVSLGLEGGASCTCWGCDITYDYIRINGDYRT